MFLIKKTVLILLSISTSTTLLMGSLLVHYSFDNPGEYIYGENVVDARSTLKVRDGSGAYVVANSGDATGVSGFDSDRAYDSSSASGMGIGFSGHYGILHEDEELEEVDGLSSFTIQGWIKPSELLDNTVEILDNSSSGAGWKLTAVNHGNLRLFVNGSNVISSVKAYNQINEWIFFAVSYDGTMSVDNVKFYVGTSGDEVTLSSTQTLNKGVVNDDSGRLRLNRSDRPLKGFFDNFRIYGDEVTNEGVLTLEELETIRLGDLEEPSIEYTNEANSSSDLVLQELETELDSENDPNNQSSRLGEHRSNLRTLVDRGIVKDFKLRDEQLYFSLLKGEAINRFAIFYAYAQLVRAKNMLPLDIEEIATYDYFVGYAKDIFQVVSQAYLTDKYNLAIQMQFAQGHFVRLFDLLDELDELSSEEETLFLGAIVESMQSVIDYRNEQGVFNRAAENGFGFAATHRLLSTHSNATEWESYANEIWDQWYVAKDTFEDSTGYKGLWFNGTINHAVEANYSVEMQHMDVQDLASSLLYYVDYNGAIGDLGDSSYFHGWEYWISNYEYLGNLYQDDAYLKQSELIVQYLMDQPGYVEYDLAALADSYSIVADYSGNESILVPNLVTQKYTTYGDSVPDKMFLTDDSTGAYLMVDLHDRGYHGHEDSASISLFSIDGNIITHELGRKAEINNHHYSAFATNMNEDVVTRNNNAHANDWITWRYTHRWPGTYTGKPPLDLENVDDSFFRIKDIDGYNGDITIDIDSIVGIDSLGVETVLSTGWSDVFTRSSTITDERSFARSPVPVIWDLSGYEYLKVKWKSNQPQAVQYFGLDGGSIIENTRSTLRSRNIQPVTSASVSEYTDYNAGYIHRMMQDSLGRDIEHDRNIALVKGRSILVIHDKFTITEAGDYKIAPIWHSESVIERGSDYYISKDNYQWEDVGYNGKAYYAVFKATEPYQFDEDVELVDNPQKYHYAPVVSKMMEEGEIVEFYTVIVPVDPESGSYSMPQDVSVDDTNGVLKVTVGELELEANQF